MTKSCPSLESAVMMSSAMPSAKYSCSASPLMLAKGKTAIDERLRSGLIGGGLARRALKVWRGGPRPRKRAPAARYFSAPSRRDRLNASLTLSRTCSLGRARQDEAARLGDTFQPGRDVNAVAHQVAVTLFDDIAEMDARCGTRCAYRSASALRSATPL